VKLMHRQPVDLGLDPLITATAIVHDLTVVTRDVRDFQRFGVEILNPWKARMQ
jgi:toxin FitB